MKIKMKMLRKLINEVGGARSNIVVGKKFDYRTLKANFPEIANRTAENASDPDYGDYETYEDYEQETDDTFMVVRKDDPTWSHLAGEVEGFDLPGFGPDYMLLAFEGTGGSNSTFVWANDEFYGWV